MALKDRFNNFEIETDEKNVKTTVIKEVIEEADLGPVFDELAVSLSQKVASIPVWFDYTEDEQRKLISDFLMKKLETNYSDISFSNEEIEHILSLFMESILGFGELDYYLARDDIRTVLVNSDGSIFVDSSQGKIKENSIITPSQFEKIYLTITARINKLDGKIKQIRLNQLVITILEPPVCEKKILFEKLKTDKVDFNFLQKDASINKEIYSFIKKLIEEKKNILITGPVSGGKTALISAIAEELDNTGRYALFENYPIINCENFDKYYTKGLNETELTDLLNVVSKLKYDYVINDTEHLPIVLNDLFKTGYCADIEAASLTQAVTKLAGYKIYNDKCTEKQAKAFICSKFDYIFLLQKDEKSLLKISSIAELSLNRAGSLVLTEILNYTDGAYRYNFSDEE